GIGDAYWRAVAEELRTRGVADPMIVHADGGEGVDEAVMAVFPRATVVTGVVGLIRQSLSAMAAKDRRAAGNDLQAVYGAPSAAAAAAALDAFADRWGERYPTIAPLWRIGWHHLERLLLLPPEVRDLVTGLSALDELNRALRR